MNEDARLLAKLLLGAGLILAAAATAGLAVRLFILAAFGG